MSKREMEAQIVQIIDKMFLLKMKDHWNNSDWDRYDELAKRKMELENRLRYEMEDEE